MSLRITGNILNTNIFRTYIPPPPFFFKKGNPDSRPHVPGFARFCTLVFLTASLPPTHMHSSLW